MIRRTKRGFSLPEVLTAIAVFGCVVVMSIIMFNHDGMDANLLQAKQARLDSALKTATLSIIGTNPGAIPAKEACTPGFWQDKLSEKIAGAKAGDDIKVNNVDAATVQIKDAGTVAIQISDKCNSEWATGGAIPVALYAVPDEDVKTIDVPTQVQAGAIANSGTTTSGDAPSSSEFTGPNKIVFSSELPLTTFSVNALASAQTFSTTGTLASGNSTTAQKVGASNNNDDDPVNHDESICKTSGTYTDKNCPGVEVKFYQYLNESNCSAFLCEGNGYDDKGNLVTTGKINAACDDGTSAATACFCPTSSPYWFPDWKIGSVAGICLSSCTKYEHMTINTSKKYECICEDGYEWDQAQKKCVKPGECKAPLVYDTKTDKCVCDKDKVDFGPDEVYDAENTTTCKKTCPSGYSPNSDHTKCLRVCNCLQTLNEQTNKCECNSQITLQQLKECSALNPGYIFDPSSPQCQKECKDGSNPDSTLKQCDCGCLKTYNYSNNKCECDVNAKDQSCLSSDEKFDASKDQCKTCKEPNRKYDESGQCVCKSANEITYKGNNWRYDPTQPDCQAPCSEDYGIRNANDKTQCVCPQTKPSNLRIEAGKQYEPSVGLTNRCQQSCPKGHYCPGTKPGAPADSPITPDENDPDKAPQDGHPDTFKCPCGTFGSQNARSNSECSGKCAAGFYCPTGSTKATESACPDGKICLYGVCEPQTCAAPLIPNGSQTECICPSADKIAVNEGFFYDPSATGNQCVTQCPTEASAIQAWIRNHSDVFKTNKVKYDYTAVGCVSTCQGNYVATSDKTSCECGLKVADTPKGKYLDPVACILVDCPEGHYCPGGDEPGDDPDFPPGVKKCPCGTYGATTGLSTATCSGKCRAGYHCPQGSTSATQEQCPAGSICLEGVCDPQACTIPTVPNSTKTACVCATVKPSSFVIPKGKHYSPTAGVANQCLASCPVGDYCPGTNPNNPDVPLVDPNDPNPVIDPSYPSGDTMKCPCGTYGATTGLSTAACSGQCTAGFYCEAGSTRDKAAACPANKVCYKGICPAHECENPLVANTAQTECICPAESAITVPAGKYYSSTATTTGCLTACPTETNAIKAWIQAHQNKFTKVTTVYDATAIGCISECTGDNIIANPDKMSCTCSLSVANTPKGQYFDSQYCQYKNCPSGHYCPGGTPVPDTPGSDPKYPGGGVIFCPCGTYGATTNLGTATCSGYCQAGYHCPQGSTSATQEQCPAGHICLEGVCESEACVTPSVPNSTKTACICATTKPDTYVIPAGKHYDANAGVTNKCLSACPTGHYCPGTNPSNPNVPIVDPNDPNPTVDPSYPTGDTMKCPCGTYGSVAGLSSAACSGKCTAGFYCAAGSTKDKAAACPASKVCYKGTCPAHTCDAPLVANPSQTECICPAESAITVPAGKYYSSTATTTGCLTACPTEANAIKAWIQAHQNKFNNAKKKYDAKAVGCISECTGNYVANADRTICECGISVQNAGKGEYFDPVTCTIKDCPVGHFCPGPDDPGVEPDDPNFPPGVKKCPCGTYGATTRLGTVSCSGKCEAGYRCPEGSTSKRAVACTDGQTCPEGTCTPGTCDFPSTSTDHKTCNACLSEAELRAEHWIGDDEEYSTELPTCKKCKSNKVKDDTGMCVCPPDEPHWYDEKCNQCRNWGTIYFLRQYNNKNKGAEQCTLYKYMQADRVCFPDSSAASGLGKQRIIGNDMKAAGKRLIEQDKNRNFKNVFAYMVADTGSEAKVIGVFTINSWYMTVSKYGDSNKDASDYSETWYKNLKPGTCEEVCKLDGSVNQECVDTCKLLNNNVVKNTMANNCKWAMNGSLAGETDRARDEYCTGGEFVMTDGCKYQVGAYLRRYSSPLVLDLKGDGLRFTSVENGVVFDLDNDGVAERISWTAPQTKFDNAFLVLDKNKNGKIDNGGELFGDQNGEKNGFFELAKYDDNDDAVIDKKDAIYNELRLWVDFNANGVVDYDKNGKTKELKTLKQAGVTEIALTYQEEKDANGNILKDIYGNITGFVGSFKMLIKNAAGKLAEVARTMIDVFFMAD